MALVVDIELDNTRMAVDRLQRVEMFCKNRMIYSNDMENTRQSRKESKLFWD
jgi:hypothetical protein